MSKPERIVSVDFLRGLTVALMILVNNPGSWEYIYPPFRHASWHGCTPTDLVFPFFLFIVGISISYSLGSAKNSMIKKAPIVLKIIKRSAILFGLGLLLNLIPNFAFESVRIPGVLQRISIVFLFSAILYLTFSVRTLIILAMLLLVGYCILMLVVPVPGIGYANLEPATNIGAWVDNLLLNGHLWSHSKVWDPEGLVSTFPAIASGLIGVVTGEWLKREMDVKDKLIRIFIAANIFIILALAWNIIFPVNKSLWTSSFVLLTSGIALHALAISYWLIDVMSYKKYTGVFMAFGSNAIVAYMLAELLANIMYSVTVVYKGANISLKGLLFKLVSVEGYPEFTSLLLAIAWVALIYIPISVMYKKKIFIKV